MLRHCLWPDEIDGIDLDSFGWDSMFGLTYGVQTGTKRRLGHSLAQIWVDEWECQLGIAELMGSILDVKVKNTFLTNANYLHTNPSGNLCSAVFLITF